MTAIDISPAHILRAMHLAMQDSNMPAVVELLHMLAVRDPDAAQAILDLIEARADDQRPMQPDPAGTHPTSVPGASQDAPDE
jgi:hypothetical protein